MRLTFILFSLSLLAACSQGGQATHQSGGEDVDFSLPADGAAGYAIVRTREDIEALPKSTTAITAGDNGSRHLQSADLRSLDRFSNLSRLKLRHCRGIGNSGVAHIAKLDTLRDLDLSGCVAITDAGIAALGQVKSLRCVILNYCPKITKPAILALQRQLPLADIIWSSDDPPLGEPPFHEGD